MKNLNTTNILSILLILPIIIGSGLIVFGFLTQYNVIIVVSIAILSIIITTLNIFNKKIIEKEVEVIVEKVIYIEKDEKEIEPKNKIQSKEEIIKIISKQDKNVNKKTYINNQISKIATHFNLDQIVFYLKDDRQKFKIAGKYAFITENEVEFTVGEGISGQVVKDEKSLYITDIPDGYITIISGLGKGNPKSLFIVPVFSENEIIGVIEYASLTEIEEEERKNIELLSNEIAIHLLNLK